MGEILGIGATHYPPGLVPDEYKPWPLIRMLKTDRIPEHMKNPANWPAEMQAEWGDDEGITAHKPTGKRSSMHSGSFGRKSTPLIPISSCSGATTSTRTSGRTSFPPSAF